MSGTADLRVFAKAAGNADLLRLGVAYVAFGGAEFGVWIALLLYGYDVGGATGASAIALVQLVPSAILAPWLGALADRHRPGRVLFAAYTALTAAMAAVAAAVALDAPSWLVFALVPFVNLAITVPRPAQAALLPSVVHTSEELTAANAGQSSLESASLIGAPLLVAVLISAGGLSLALAGMTLTALIAAVAAAPITGLPPFAADEARDGDGGTAMRALRLVAADPPTRLLVLTLGSQFMLLGALDLLCVVLAVEALGIGESGAGYLNAAIGIGGVAALAVTARLVGRARIAPALLAGALAATVPLVLLAVHTTTASAVILLAIVGLGRCVFDVSGRTLLQRTAAPAALAGVFALLESMLNVGLAAGSLLVPLLIALGGADAALVGVAAVLLLLLALAAPRLVRLDEAAHVPLVQMHVLRAITIFRALPAPTLETLARSVEHAPIEAGTTLMRQGEVGERYFAIASGDLSILIDGAEIAVRSRGEGVGEIALLRDMPRTATVIARTDAELYALDREPFLLAVTGHAPALRSADSLIDERLAHLPD